jgi:SAM-dependent methyltransferase
MTTQQTQTPEIDGNRAEAFATRLVGILNSGSLALMTSVGHRTGLFDALGRLPPATSARIAEEAQLDERYVREWLAAMVAGGIVEYDATRSAYHLPPEHAACLTRAATPNNLAAMAQYIPLMGSIEDRILECFAHGGGLPYSAYPRFEEVMAEDSGQTVVAALLEHILPLVDGLTERLRQGITVLDVGCGSGRALNLLAETFPRSRFVGYDLLQSHVDAGRAQAEASRLGNVTFEVKDLTTLEEVERYDLITAFDAIHDQARPGEVVERIARALRPDGVFLMQDISASSHLHENVDHPIGPLLDTISCMHCMSVSLAAGGEGLGAMWGRHKALELLAGAGFADVAVRQLPHDLQNDYYIARR